MSRRSAVQPIRQTTTHVGVRVTCGLVLALIVTIGSPALAQTTVEWVGGVGS